MGGNQAKFGTRNIGIETDIKSNQAKFDARNI